MHIPDHRLQVLALLVISPVAGLLVASSLVCIVILAFMHRQVPLSPGNPLLLLPCLAINP
jgi:hypothetical protein